MGATVAYIAVAGSMAYSAYSSRKGRKDTERTMQKRTWAEQAAQQEADRAEAQAAKDKEAAAKKEEMDLAAKKSKRRRDMAMFGREGTFKTSLFGTKDDDVMLAKKNLYGQ